MNIFILGGITDDTDISESKAGGIFLEKNGVPSKNIVLEESSRNTLENLKQFKLSSAVKNTNYILVSNQYHLSRAVVMANGFNLQVTPCSAEKELKFSMMFIINILIEAFHLHWYLVGKYFAKITNNKRMLSKIQ